MNTKEAKGNDLNTLLTGYNVSAEMTRYEATLVWNKVMALLIANSILASIVSFGVNTIKLAVLCSLLGIVISFSWIVLINRGVKTFRYWIAKARYYEKLISNLGTEVNIFGEGNKLGTKDGTSISLPDESKPLEFRFEGIERLASGKFIEGWLLPIVFIIFYLLLIIVILYP